MAERDRARAPVLDQRLRVRPLRRAGRRVARVADRELPVQAAQLLLVEDLGDEAHVAEHRQPARGPRPRSRPTPDRGAGARAGRSARAARRRGRVRRCRGRRTSVRKPPPYGSILHRGSRPSCQAARSCTRRTPSSRSPPTTPSSRSGTPSSRPTSPGAHAITAWPPPSPNRVVGVVVEVELGADAAPDRRLGERDREPARGCVVREREQRRRPPEEARRAVPRRRGPGSAGGRRARRRAPGTRSRRARPRARPRAARRRPPASAPGPRARRGRARRSRRPASAGSRARRSRCRARRFRRRPGCRSASAASAIPSIASTSSQAISRLLGVAEVEAVGQAERLAAGAGDVARRLEHGERAARPRVEAGDPARPVERDREPAQRRPQAQHGGVEARPADRARADEVVVLLVDPGPAADVRRGEQLEQRLLSRRALRRGGLGARAARRRFDPVARRLVGQEVGRDLADHLAVVEGPQLARVRDLADRIALQLPAGADLLDRVEERRAGRPRPSAPGSPRS